MAELICLVGLPASGKSTYTKELESKGYSVHSSDSIREELYGDENVQGKPEKVFRILHERIASDLKQNKNCVYDATNISSKRRTGFLNSISYIGCKKICILFATPYEDCLKRNQNRDRKVPEDVIKKMYTNFNIPSYYEGWDEIRAVWSDFDKEKYSHTDVISKYKDYNQHNSHHSLTLGEHLSKCYSIASNYRNQFSYPVWKAAEYHDCGKPFVASFFDAKGNPSKDCHYYRHENVSAYETLFFLCSRAEAFNLDIQSVLYVCALVNLHMKPYTWKEDKIRKKYKKLLGDKMYKDLMDLHYCDVNAH